MSLWAALNFIMYFVMTLCIEITVIFLRSHLLGFIRYLHSGINLNVKHVTVTYNT